MDVIKSVQNYINKMISEVTGMKVLLLDAETTAIISVVLTQTQLLSKEIYLIDRVDNRQREKIKHLRCICFVRPTGESVQALVEELRDPCYADYYLYFSNSLKKSSIERLAEVDEHEVVREVQEYFGDYLALNPDLYSLNVAAPQWPLFIENSATWDTRTLARVTEGVLAVLLSLKKKPLIRYEKSSILAKKLATEISYQIQQEGPLFDFRRTDTPPILLLMDRRNDPVSPLLNQWTYQAMVHDLLGISNGRVDLSQMPDVKPEMKEIVLSLDQDSFYKETLYLNLGDLGAKIKEYVDTYQVKHKSSQSIESIADMKKFVEDYPEFRKLSGNVTKHVTLVGELSRLVAKQKLMEVGELEQSLAVAENHNADVKSLRQMIERTDITADAKIRLVLLYALRYEKSQTNLTQQLVDLLARNGVSEKKVALVAQMIQYAGTDQRLEDIFSNQNVFARTKNVFKGLKGVENVYTQHTPHLVETLQEAIKGRLKEQLYPFIEGGTRDKPQDIIVFMIGGATYAEAREVNKLNASGTGVRIVLGGTTVHNAQRYVTSSALLSLEEVHCVLVVAHHRTPVSYLFSMHIPYHSLPLCSSLHLFDHSSTEHSFMREVADSVTRWTGKSGPTSPPQQRLRSARND
ncbi:vacuolar protein sorting-associated protein 45 [Borealophlyctis nickersoniae]|nr:vacuolar protein sorting-associated protein 45 [Borealophlyctis nickersoniae]